MRNIVLAMLVYSASASADIYRCQINGHTTFRDRPCQRAEPAPAQPADAMTGCYRVDAPGWESGRNVYVVKIAAKGGGRFEWTDPTVKTAPAIPMRRASAQELLLVTKLLRFPATAGMVMDVPKQTPNQPPVPLGLYKGKDDYLDTVYAFYGFLANGMAKRTSCP